MKGVVCDYAMGTICMSICTLLYINLFQEIDHKISIKINFKQQKIRPVHGTGYSNPPIFSLYYTLCYSNPTKYRSKKIKNSHL